MAKRMSKMEMAIEIAEKWERESLLNLGVEWRANDIVKRHGWSEIARMYEKEIGKVRGVNY